MKTLGEVLSLSVQYLKEKQVPRARREAENLLCDALNIERIQLYMDEERPLLESELDLCRQRLARRARGEPLAYIHGSVTFFECQIKTTPCALIPRQETEILVDKMVQVLKEQDLEGKCFWDVCCGTGCIGIAIKKHFPQLSVELSDVSSAAVELAQHNAALNKVDLVVHQGDLLKPFKNRTCDFFVCNPPYVSEEEYPSLDREVRDHEPRLALVAAEEGLAFYRRLAAELPPCLNPHAQAWFEIGTGQGKALQDLFSTSPWKNQQLEQDWAGHDRFFSLENE